MLYNNYMSTNENEESNNEIRLRRNKRSKVFPGIILVVLGIIFLLNNYGLTNFDIGKLWPLFLVLPGILMLFESYKER